MLEVFSKLADYLASKMPAEPYPGKKRSEWMGVAFDYIEAGSVNDLSALVERYPVLVQAKLPQKEIYKNEVMFFSKRDIYYFGGKTLLEAARELESSGCLAALMAQQERAELGKSIMLRAGSIGSKGPTRL